MKVTRGATVKWTEPAPVPVGASRYQRAAAGDVERFGTVLDRAPGASWWVLPRDERNAVAVPARKLEPARVMP